MAYKRKTYDQYLVQGYYSREYGWEDVYPADNRRDAKERLKEYRANEKGIAFRIHKARVILQG